MMSAWTHPSEPCTSTRFDDEQLDVSFTVAICTLNRRTLLVKAVTGVLQQLRPFRNGRVLVVDNGSSDGTRDLLQRWSAEDSRLDYVVEDRRGNYFARAAAIREATGEFLIFLDDDAVPHDGWLRGMLSALTNAPDVGAVGGRIDPIWEVPPPAWLSAKLAENLPLTLNDGANASHKFPCHLPSISLGLRLNACAKLFIASDRYDDYPLGRTYSKRTDELSVPLMGGEDVDLVEIYARSGFRVLSRHDIAVSHFVPAGRLTPAWFYRKFEGDGHVRVRLARLAGYSLWEGKAFAMLAALPVFAALNLLGPLLPQRKSVLIAAYYHKCRGAWRELLFGPRGRVLAYRADAS